jgi:hypothetical protein
MPQPTIRALTAISVESCLRLAVPNLATATRKDVWMWIRDTALDVEGNRHAPTFLSEHDQYLVDSKTSAV